MHPITENNTNYSETVGKGIVKYSSVITLTFTLLILFEVFSGALRFYLDQFGLVFLIYFPKAICMIFVLTELFDIKNFRRTGISIVALLISCYIGLYNGAKLSNILFSLFNYSPLLFGVFFGKYIKIRSYEFNLLVKLSLYISLAGVILDHFVTLPWEGFNYSLGDLEIQGNRQWSTMGLERVTGFSRVSSSLAIMLAVFALFLTASEKSNKTYIICVTLLVFYCIFLTTSKSVLVAYLVALFATFFLRLRLIKIFLATIVVIGLCLPFSIVFLKYQGLSQLITSDFGVFLLASFDARVTYTWPSFYELVLQHNGFYWGTGFGTVGSTVSTFKIPTISGTLRQSLAVADNTALYLWGMFGIVGIIIYLCSYNVMIRLRSHYKSKLYFPVEILVCLVISSWAVDILETITGCLFVGFAISFAYGVNQKKQK